MIFVYHKLQLVISFMSVTQKDISAYLGIPRITVARALTGGRVSESTRTRVLDAAQHLGYTTSTNRDARQLIARRYGRRALTDVVAVLLPALDSPVRGNAFFGPLLEGIEAEAEIRRLDTVICVSRRRGIPSIIQNGVDGVITLGSGSEMFGPLTDLNLPVVTATIYTEPFHSVLSEDRRGIDLVIDYLYSLGHRKIAYCGYETDSIVSMSRFDAYRIGLESRGLQVDPRFIELGAWRRETAEIAIGELLARSTTNGEELPDFTAIVCYNDHFASLASGALERRGTRVPRDVSVTGYDATTLVSGALPKITSVGYDRVEMGRIAVDILCRVRSLPAMGAISPIVERVPVVLHVLDSTAAPRPSEC